MTDLYTNIKSLCDDHGITIGKMCRDTGVRSGNISDMKYGRHSGMGAKNLQKIADYFGVSVDRVVTGKDTTVSVDEDKEELLQELHDRPEMKMLFSASKNATKEQIESVVKLLESFNKDKN